MTSAATDTLGTSGVFRDPLWRVTVTLTALEQELLRCWWVRRLGFIAHAGAAVITTTQSYSRLEHSLGLLALVAHFDPNDQVARAAALLHDVGHLPFSHTFENVAGLNHHELGALRTTELDSVLRRHGLDAAMVLDVEHGRRPSVLRGTPGVLRLDHLESFVRSARAHGRTRQPPPVTLARLRVLDGAVDTDTDTAAYLTDLVAGEARSQCSPSNIVATGLMRHFADQLLTQMSIARRMEVAEMTDDEFWSLLLSSSATRSSARLLRRNPAAWQVIDATELPANHRLSRAGRIEHRLSRLYLDLPLIDGRLPSDTAGFENLPSLPRKYVIVRQEQEPHRTP